MEAGAHFQPTHFQLLLGDQLGQFLGHPAGEVRRGAVEVFRRCRSQVQFGIEGLGGFRGGDESLLVHPVEHQGTLLQSQVGIHQR